MIKLVIFGSRHVVPSFRDIEDNLDGACHEWGFHWNYIGGEIELGCGMAAGADSKGRMWAQSLDIPVRRFYAEWKNGKLAGHTRNLAMAEWCTHALGFWDGSSGGTANMCAQLVLLRKPCRLVKLPVADSEGSTKVWPTKGAGDGIKTSGKPFDVLPSIDGNSGMRL